MKGLVHLFILLLLSGILYAQKDCRQAEYDQIILSENPTTFNDLKAFEGLSRITSRASATIPEVIVIPVVVHILYNKANQNISDAQVMSQIEALNADFRGRNEDKIKTPHYFAAVAADCGIEFQLAKQDPNGLATTGIVRKSTSIQYFGLDDRAKASSRGGDDPWDSEKYLNIWVCNLAGGVLGYSSNPGGPKEKDGVVISLSCFGTIGSLSSSFNKGRTATHEVGHWLNLRHIWGDTYCGDDHVDDTPKQRSSNRGCITGKKYTCESTGDGEMYMNFMDLTDDGCMFMFTKGQRERMRSLFLEGGPRNKILHSTALDTASITKPAESTFPGAAANVTVSLFPNPASSFLSIQLRNVPKETTVNRMILIYDRFGNLITKDLMQSTEKFVSISTLKPGLYYLHMLDGNSKSVLKFIKL